MSGRALLSRLPALVAAHLSLTLLALAIGVAVSVPLGVLVSRHRRLETAVLGLAGVLQTVPSLALLAGLVVALSALGARSIGYLPALLGLTVYSLLPVLANTVAGLSALDPAVLSAARAVGMTPFEQLRRVELPLALPTILAGVRTAAVWTVGTATLSTPVGAPSLGDYIFGGLQTRDDAAVLVGCAASASLALTLDTLVRGLSVGVARRRPRLVAACLAGFAVLSGIAAAPSAAHLLDRRRAPLTIGAKTFTEQYILGEILAQRVGRSTGLPTRTLGSLGSTVVLDALRTGAVDAYVDYSGTLWADALRERGPAPDRAALLRALEVELPRRFGVHVVAALGFENTYALAMRRRDGARLGVRTVGDLAPLAPRLRVGGDYEIFTRPEWLALTRVYELRFGEQRSMDPTLLYEAVHRGQVDVITAFSTDGRITSLDLVVLEDDRRALPPYDALVLVSDRLLREYPEAVEALRGLAGRIDDERMRRMNAAVDARHEPPAEVARRFLEQLGR